MPGYIGYRPQFDPIGLQDYLAVPTMIMSEYAKAEDVYNETANKAEALKALLGERNADNEAGWKIVDNYEKQLGDLANNIAKGIQGPEAYRQAKSSSRYYRENMLPLESGIPAYQKELERYNSDPSMVGARPVLENYIKNPLYKGYMLSGDKIYTDMVNQGKMAAADRSANEIKKSGVAGYISHIQRVGYSPEEQQEYLGLVQKALKNDEDAIQTLQNSDKYSQLYQGLNAYIKDHAFDQLDYNGKLNALDRAISGQLHGMTGTSKEELKEDKIWASANALNNQMRLKKWEWENDPSKQPQIDLGQNRGTYINQYDENQDIALEKMSKTVDYNGKKINPIQAKRIINKLNTIVQNSEKYQKLLTERGAFFVDHPEYKGKSPDSFNRHTIANKRYFEIMDAISEFENDNNSTNYVKTREELAKLKNNINTLKDTFSDILYSDKKLKEYGEQLGFNPDDSEEKIYANLKTNNRIYVGTLINASNKAGETLKDDISGSLTQTISVNPANLKRVVKSVGGKDSAKLEDILVVSKDSATGQNKYGGNDYYITLESIIDGSIATTGKQLTKNKNKNNVYLIPLEMFDKAAATAVYNSLTQLNTDEYGNEYIKGFDPKNKNYREKLVDLYERNGLEEVIKNTITASIFEYYGHNFFQYQPNTTSKE